MIPGNKVPTAAALQFALRIATMEQDLGKLRHDLEEEEGEMKKKITSDDIHEGFESHVRVYYHSYPSSQYRINQTMLICLAVRPSKT